MLKKILAVGFFICALISMSDIVSAQEVFIRDEVLPVTNYIYHNTDGETFGNTKYMEKSPEVKTDVNNNETDAADATEKTSTEESLEDMTKEVPDNSED